MVTLVTGKNQVTIPAELARQAHIQQGSRLDWNLDEKKRELRVRILPSRGELARQLLGAGRKYIKPGEDWIKELCEERGREDEDETRNLS